MDHHYDRRQANRISLRIVIAVAIAFAAYLAVELSIDPISANERGVRAIGIFGFDLAYSSIRDAQFLTGPAPVGKRIFGEEAFGLLREGNYEVEGIGPARVFLKKPYVSYLLLKTDDRDYVLSLGSVEKDTLLFDRIKLAMK